MMEGAPFFTRWELDGDCIGVNGMLLYHLQQHQHHILAVWLEVCLLFKTLLFWLNSRHCSLCHPLHDCDCPHRSSVATQQTLRSRHSPAPKNKSGAFTACPVIVLLQTPELQLHFAFQGLAPAHTQPACGRR